VMWCGAVCCVQYTFYDGLSVSRRKHGQCAQGPADDACRGIRWWWWFQGLVA